MDLLHKALADRTTPPLAWAHLSHGFRGQQLPQPALGSKTPLQAMKGWQKLKPELFNKQPYYLPGCDN